LPIIREFRCRDCSTTFESFDEDPECPSCTAPESERVFLTAPNIRSDKTSRADTIAKELASDFGMSNMTNKYGQPVKGNPDTGKNFGDQKIMQTLAGLGEAGDNFSAVAPAIRQAGNPRTWTKTPEARRR